MRASNCCKTKDSAIASKMAQALKPLHEKFVLHNRLTRLGSALSPFLPEQDCTVLDIGCGPGYLTKQLFLLHPNLSFSGADVLERVEPEISKWLDYKNYDGKQLPYPDKSFTCSTLIDVLHHTDDPKILLSEAVRVSREFILIKDHISESIWDNFILRFMDWMGNRSYGVHLPYNYLSANDWQKLFEELRLTVQYKTDNIGLYQAPLSLLFERKLHFIAKLTVDPNHKQ